MKYVLYHGDNCSDGFCSAWLCHQVFGDNATYIACSYGTVPELPNDSAIELYIVDFSFPEEVLRQWATAGFKIVVLDHHKTATHIQKLIDEQVVEGKFDLDHSGARLTADWLTYTESVCFSLDTWDIINYVEDRDLWTWKLICSKDINSAIRSYPLTFDSWYAICNIPDMLDELAIEGRAINRYRSRLISEHTSMARHIVIDNDKVFGCTTTCLELVSDIGHELCKIDGAGPFSVVDYKINAKMVKVSLRSLEGGSDVSEIAKRYGGGGHKHAAGYTYKS